MEELLIIVCSLLSRSRTRHIRIHCMPFLTSTAAGNRYPAFESGVCIHARSLSVLVHDSSRSRTVRRLFRTELEGIMPDTPNTISPYHIAVQVYITASVEAALEADVHILCYAM